MTLRLSACFHKHLQSLSFALFFPLIVSHPVPPFFFSPSISLSPLPKAEKTLLPECVLELHSCRRMKYSRLTQTFWG